ncbi:uncharacterized protein LOC119090494 [Pollicipes pollicipes]|uniref:uncharacterized protein LOC119090494 n=1 Tax=Pollicipes pollicipes TaxID=41117 RepID=UPI001885498A|nr:uncharacterized protein LOC119090494 [Pollicipes pollicipes]
MLAAVDAYYEDVSRLRDVMTDLCQLPLLIGHATSMATILLTSYTILNKAFKADHQGRAMQLASMGSYLCLFVCRITCYSLDGSSIMEKNAALASSLTKLRWPDMTKADRRRREALLQKTKLPFGIDVMGFFSVQKTNILSILSFALTYFVILVQMGGSALQ